MAIGKAISDCHFSFQAEKWAKKCRQIKQQISATIKFVWFFLPFLTEFCHFASFLILKTDNAVLALDMFFKVLHTYVNYGNTGCGVFKGGIQNKIGF